MPEDKLQKLEVFFARFHLTHSDALMLLATLFATSHPEQESLASVGPFQQQQKTIASLLTWLLTEADQQPVCIVVEDLHWADPATLTWLNLMIAQVPTTRLLLLLTYRPEFQPPWQAQSHLTRLTLDRLTKSQIEDMIVRVADGNTLPEAIVKELVTKTDGVPLFVEEMTRMVLESGLVKEKEGPVYLGRFVPASDHSVDPERFANCQIGPA